MHQSAGKQVMRSEWLAMLLLFLACLGVYSLNWHVGYGESFGRVFGDVTATAAERVQAGEIPYRDFWTMYAPGSFYLLALLFTLFGNNIIVSSVAASVLLAGAASVVFCMVSTLLGRRWPGLVCALVFFGATYSTNYYLSLGPYPPTILLVLLALYAMVHYYRSGGRAWLFAAGLATGMAIVFKHDVGGYTAIAIMLGLLLGHVPVIRASVGLGDSPLSAFTVYSSAVALVSLPVAVYFAVLSGYDMWQDLIVFPATDFQYTRGEHYPELIPRDFTDDWWLRTVFNFLRYMQFTLPFLMFVLAIPVLLAAALKRKMDYLPIAVTFAIAYLFHYGSAHIQINTNIMSLALYGILLGVIAFDLMERQLKPAGRTLLRAAGFAYALFLFISYLALPLYMRVRNVQDHVVLTLPKISGLKVSPDMGATMTGLVSFVNRNVPGDRKIFVGLHRHDTVVVGDGKMYFILDRRNATRHDQLHPGIVDTAKIQREMIRDLQRHDVKYLIIRHVFDDKTLDRFKETLKTTLPQSGATKLDAFIWKNYEVIDSIGQYEIWERKV